MDKLMECDNQKFLDNMYLVKYIANKIIKTLPEYIDIRDLEQYGYIGLIDAINKYDESYKTKFSTYAYRRIRGEIIDGLRRMNGRTFKWLDNKKVFSFNDFPESAYCDERSDRFVERILSKMVILQLMAKLLPIESFVLLCKYYGSLNNSEIADLLGCSYDRVCSYITEGRRRLKNFLSRAKWQW